MGLCLDGWVFYHLPDSWWSLTFSSGSIDWLVDSHDWIGNRGVSRKQRGESDGCMEGASANQVGQGFGGKVLAICVKQTKAVNRKERIAVPAFRTANKPCLFPTFHGSSFYSPRTSAVTPTDEVFEEIATPLYSPRTAGFAGTGVPTHTRTPLPARETSFVRACANIASRTHDTAKHCIAHRHTAIVGGQTPADMALAGGLARGMLFSSNARPRGQAQTPTSPVSSAPINSPPD